MENLPNKLKELRAEKGLSQAAVSSALGLTRNDYGNYEMGIREPSLSVLKQLCDLFEVSADYLIGRTDSY